MKSLKQDLFGENIFDVCESKDIDDEVEKLFKYFRKVGFPHYDIKDYCKNNELEKLKNFNEKEILVGDDIKQTMHSLGFLWCYFPNWVDVTYKNQEQGLLELWNDDEKLKTLIKKTYKWQLKFGNGVFTINRLRQNAKIYLSKQSVSNFRPTASKYFYNAYGNNGVVWDMSSGWGGRLFGFLASNCNTYIGTEPCRKTYNGLIKLKESYRKENKKVEIYNLCAENYIPNKNSVDLCFTSPPYFDCERYSKEKTQSYIKHPTKELWVNNFLRRMIKNCYYSLKQDGHMILNIANTSHHKWIEDCVLDVCKEENFKLVKMNYLILSSVSGKGVKREPIFIYKKEKPCQKN